MSLTQTSLIRRRKFQPVPGSELVGKRAKSKRGRKNARGLPRAYDFHVPLLFAPTLLSESLEQAKEVPTISVGGRNFHVCIHDKKMYFYPLTGHTTWISKHGFEAMICCHIVGSISFQNTIYAQISVDVL